jgi:hypothetical protein
VIKHRKIGTSFTVEIEEGSFIGKQSVSTFTLEKRLDNPKVSKNIKHVVLAEDKAKLFKEL